MKVVDVANYFIHRSQLEGEDGLITNLKLQKLCYYAQGFYLATNDDPLFEEPLEAWKHGPVSRVLYASLADKGSVPISELMPSDMSIDDISGDIKTYLDDIYLEYGQFSAWALREMTHKEKPWLENWNSALQIGRVIPNEQLKTYFKSRLNDGEI